MLYNTSVSKKKKIIITVSVLVCAAIIMLTSLLLVFLLKPDSAKGVIIEARDYQVFVKTDIVEENRTYRFKFTSNGESKEINSDSHVLEITDLLWNGELQLGKEYRVSVCLVEPSGILAGDYSNESVFTPSLKLKSPVISYNEQECKISWEAVQGADFYNVCYIDGTELVKEQTTELSFGLTKLKGGERNVFVTASSVSSYLKESDNSNFVNVTITHTLQAFSRATIDHEHFVSIISPEKVDGIVVVTGSDNKRLVITEFETIKTVNGYELFFSADSFYKSGEAIYVMPKADQFNIFLGQPTLVEQ